MRKTFLVLSLLTLLSAPACVRDDGRGAMSSTSYHLDPDAKTVVVGAGATALFLAFMWLRYQH